MGTNFKRQKALALNDLIGGGETEEPEFGPPPTIGRACGHAMTPSGGIPAMASLTMGSATCDLYDCSSSGVLSDSGDNATIYNMSGKAVAGSTHIVWDWNTAGLRVAIVESCPAS